MIKILKVTEAFSSRVYTVEHEGETYVAVVLLGPPRALGAVLLVRANRECRKTSVRKAIWETVKGG